MVLLKMEVLTTEYRCEVEQEMLKHVHDLRNDLREKGWLKRNFRGFPNHISEE
tara:strand:+ start:195 stop:353 length:159 start_codon:yes stop_codon:yes gene_type:complete